MKSAPIAVALLLGLLTAFACVPLIGISSAIAAPAQWFHWARSHGVLELALLMWGVVVVGGIGVVAYLEPIPSPARVAWWAFGKEIALALVAIGVLASDRRHA